jgi:hypothetical protein
LDVQLAQLLSYASALRLHLKKHSSKGQAGKQAAGSMQAGRNIPTDLVFVLAFVGQAGTEFTKYM